MSRGLSVRRVLAELEKLYDPPHTFLDHRSPFELLVATILSAQCTDARVNLVTPGLFRKYRTPGDYLRVPEEELQEDIRSCGYYRAKTRAIRGSSRMILEDFGGTVPETMEELTRLPGVGRKTAAVILYAAFGKREGIAVDTHVQRLAQRMGLTRHAAPAKIELDLMRQTPREKWGELNTLLISHGRAVCTARARKCGACVFRDECPSTLVLGREDLAGRKRKR